MTQMNRNIISRIFDDFLSGAGPKGNMKVSRAARATGEDRADISNDALVLRIVKNTDDYVCDDIRADVSWRTKRVEPRDLLFH